MFLEKNRERWRERRNYRQRWKEEERAKTVKGERKGLKERVLLIVSFLRDRSSGCHKVSPSLPSKERERERERAAEGRSLVARRPPGREKVAWRVKCTADSVSRVATT